MAPKRMHATSKEAKALQQRSVVQGHRLSQEERILAKTRFLDAMGRMNNKTRACEHAGVTFQTQTNWVREGFVTQEELDLAFDKFQDFLREEILRRAIVGDEQPLVYNGRIVLNDKTGQPETILKKDNRMLLEFCKRYLPEFMQPEKIEISQTVVDGIPANSRIVIDARELLPDEFTRIMQIAEAIEMRRNAGQIIEGSLV